MSKFESWFWAIVIFLAILLLYLITVGNLDLTSKVGPKEFKESNDLAKKRQKKLKELMDKKVGLKQKLKKRFKIVYWTARLILAGIYIAYNLLLYFQLNITDLGSILNWNEAAIIVITLISFVAFGSLSNVKEFIDIIKTRIENYVYGKYINIDEQINEHKQELTGLTTVESKG